MTSPAKSPLERLQFIAQVQGHPQSNEEDVATAAAIARFVNSKSGVTFLHFDALARILRISRRRLFARLKRLRERGHISVTRRGRAPPEISAILLPDCVTEVSRGCTSETFPEVSRGCTSGKASEVSSGDALRCRRSSVSHSKQTVQDDDNKGRTREYGGNAVERERPKPQFSGSSAAGEIEPPRAAPLGAPPTTAPPPKPKRKYAKRPDYRAINARMAEEDRRASKFRH